MFIKQILHHLNRRDTSLFPVFTKKLKITTFITISLLTIFTTYQIFASVSEKTADSFVKKQEAMTQGNNQESWMLESAGSNMMVGINMLAGPIEKKVLLNMKNDWTPNGIIGISNKAIAYLYIPPLSGVQYIAQSIENFLGKPAYAATGFQGLSTLLPLWKGFRNATYAIFSIVFIIMGIMIMLRIKISPQAVITIQNSIPKLITSLILVTFSYAIVGLLIDLSYVIEAIGISIILKASGSTQLTSTIVQNPDTWVRIADLVFSPGSAIAEILATTGAAVAIGVLGLGPMAVIVTILILLVGFIIVAIYIIKFFFNLAKCYLNIIIKTIIAPLEIALGAIPNMKMGFGSWFIDIIANILVFPISLIFLVIVKAIMDAVAAGNNMWTPSGLEFLGGGGLLSFVIGLGSLMIVSKLPQMIPEFIFQIKPSPFGKAIGESFGNIPIASSAYKSVSKAGSEKFGEFVTSNKKGLIPSLKAKWNTRKEGQKSNAANSKITPLKKDTF